MYKLKNSYIDRMIERQISSREIDFILFLAAMQDDVGRVHSVYYRDVCDALNISIQKFYDLLRSLEKQGLIAYEKKNRVDYCVMLLGNDCSDGQFQDGYLKVASMNFRSERFRSLKAGAKLLYLYMQRFRQGKHMLVQKFYENFCELFQKSKKSIKIYMHELKASSLLFVSKKRNKANRYEMMMKNSTVILIDRAKIGNEQEGYLRNLRSMIRNNFKCALPEHSVQKTLEDIANLARSERAKQFKDFPFLIVEAVKLSLERQREEGKKKPVLNAAFVNACLTGMLEDIWAGRRGAPEQYIKFN